MVAKFVYSLLRANKSQQDAFYAMQVPKVVFKELQPEIRWIYDYKDKNKHYPSLSSFKSRFPNTKLLKTRDNVETSFQAVLDQHLFGEVSSLVEKAKEMYSGGRSMSEVIGYMRKASQEISTFDTGYIDMDVRKSDSAFKRYKQRVADRIKGHSSLSPSPWPSYNALVGYSEAGEHNIITSRTSIGKTWCALNWSKHYVQCGETVMVVSKEMPTHQIGDRYECLEFGISYPDFRNGTLSPQEVARWVKERKKFGVNGNNYGGRLVITGQETITGVGFSHIISKVQQYRPTVLFVDGAYLIQPEGLNRNASSVEKFTAISNTMKRLCMAFKIIGFSIVQVNREAENKAGDTTPSLKNIYGADAWAQDADNVFIIGGKRGSKTRIGSLAKGRESNIGEFSFKYELSPRPDFSELRTLKSLSEGGSVEFQGV
jgi:replicative DNA helicase